MPAHIDGSEKRKFARALDLSGRVVPRLDDHIAVNFASVCLLVGRSGAARTCATKPLHSLRLNVRMRPLRMTKEQNVLHAVN